LLRFDHVRKTFGDVVAVENLVLEVRRWLQAVSHFSPVKWAILGLEGALWRGLSLREMALPCGVLQGVGTGCFLVGVRAFRRVREQ
jgi:hypothetical protein